MNRTAHVLIGVALAVAGCGETQPVDQEPVEPSAAANFRGYAAVQDDLYVKFLAGDSSFELFEYLGPDGAELSRLVGRPDGFGVTFDTRNAKPNGMNVLVWRMMLSRFATDLAATCPGSALVPAAQPEIVLNGRAARVVGALCAWPAVEDQTLTDAWDLVMGFRATTESRDAWIAFARSAELQGRAADKALPSLWLGALVHPAFLLEQ